VSESTNDPSSPPLRAVTVFCGSNAGTDPAYAAAARALGEVLVERSIALVYGGGRVGLMGIVADTVLAGGGHVTGVIPQHLWDKEVGHAGLSELLIVDSMHERKLAMADRGDAFIALPGGVGTLEELFEAITWTQLGIQQKPCAVLDVAGFYEPMLAFLDRTVDAGFLRPDHRNLVLSDTDPAELLDRLAAWQPLDVPKWLDEEQR
jgi:uncharacterized protein (TIGR00730 family)